MNREQFLKERQQGLGGSDIAAILGVSKWKTPLMVWRDKVEPIVLKDEDNVINRLTIGQKLEATIIDLYRIWLRGKGIEEQVINSADFKDGGFLKCEKYNWLIGHLDAILFLCNESATIIEAKSTAFYNDDWGDEGTNEVPIAYKLQVALYCLLYNHIYDTPNVDADIAVLGATHDFRVYNYTRDKNLEEEIIEKTHEFWHKYVISKEPPPPTERDNINEIYPRSMTDKTIVADNAISDIAYDLREVKQQKKELDEREKLLENEIKIFMKDSEVLVDIDGTPLCSWKGQQSTRIDSKKFKAENPELYKSFCYQSESRPLRLKIK